MKKKLSLDKELVTSAENVVVDGGITTETIVTALSCQATMCPSYCWPTACTCSDEEI